MDPQLRAQLTDALEQAFATPAALLLWVTLRVHGVNPNNIIIGAKALRAQILDLLTWSEAQGRDQEVLQLLADFPPGGSLTIRSAIFRLTDGDVRPRGTQMPPVAPCDDWFVTQRPFVNRKHFRSLLGTLDVAGPGGDSILVIEGSKASGKTHSVRFAKQCAAHRKIAVDVKDWTGNLMSAGELAAAIYPFESVPAYDPTKEDAAVPRLMTWLLGKLNDGQPTWVLLDHCTLPNLSQGATALLALFSSKIEAGDLPQVRLIIADIDRKYLPKGLQRVDVADLPQRVDVQHWCETLADHLGKAYQPADIVGYVDSVFAGLPAAPAPELLTGVLETRLADVYKKIQAL
jgi:hypothetical protein